MTDHRWRDPWHASSIPLRASSANSMVVLPVAELNLSSFCTSRNFGCRESRSHSKSTISDVTISAPCCLARAIAAARSAGSREPIASAATSTRRPEPTRPSTVCRTQTWASHPATTISPAPGGSSAEKPGASAAENVGLGQHGLRVSGERGYRGAQSSRILLGRVHRDVQQPCRLGQPHGPGNDDLVVMDGGHQPLLQVDQQQRGTLGGK